MADMKIGPHGLAVVKAFESCMAAMKSKPGYFAAYYDPVNVLTIGWGHTNHHLPKFDAATVWSQAKCDEVLASDMKVFEDHVNRMAKVPLEQHEFDALVSWSFNTGGPSHASVWGRLNAGDKAGVPGALALWNKAGGRVLNGLTRRRKAEGLLFQGKIKEAYQVAGITKKPVATKTSTAVVIATTTGTVAAGINQGWSPAVWIIAGCLLAIGIAAFIYFKTRN